MLDITNLMDKNLPHITTNTLILIIIGIVALYILIKVVSNLLKIIAFIAVCWFLLMSVQSTNLVNIPIIKQTYSAIERIIPSKELWTKASSYIKEIDKINKDISK